MSNFDRPLPILHYKQWQNPTSHLHSMHSIKLLRDNPNKFRRYFLLVLKVKTAPFVYCTQPKNHINKGPLQHQQECVCVVVPLWRCSWRTEHCLQSVNGAGKQTTARSGSSAWPSWGGLPAAQNSGPAHSHPLQDKHHVMRIQCTQQLPLTKDKQSFCNRKTHTQTIQTTV